MDSFTHSLAGGCSLAMVTRLEKLGTKMGTTQVAKMREHKPRF